MSRHQLVKMIGFTVTTIQNWEKGDGISYKKYGDLLAKALDIDISQLLEESQAETSETAEGATAVVNGRPSPPFTTDEDRMPYGTPYNKDTAADPPPRSTAMSPPAPGRGSGIDPALQAMSDIKDIFASHDPILVPAIQANINAFKRALLRERQVGQLIQENRDLKKRITRLETLCDEFKNQIELLKQENHTLRFEINRLKATYEGPSGGSGGLANTSEG